MAVMVSVEMMHDGGGGDDAEDGNVCLVQKVNTTARASKRTGGKTFGGGAGGGCSGVGVVDVHCATAEHVCCSQDFECCRGISTLQTHRL